MYVRGLGLVSNCPSLAQLQGVIDPSDPCQQLLSETGDTVVLPSAGPAANSITPPPGFQCMPGDKAVYENGYWLCKPAGSGGLIEWVKANPLALAGLGASVLFLLSFSSGGRRR